MKHRRWLWLTVSGVLCAALLAGVLCVHPFPTAVVSGSEQRRPILIDAGHGEFDGGALAPDGTQEKDINLQIASKLSMMLTALGYEVVMTRRSDKGLHADDNVAIREKKVSDMNARLALYDNAWFNISIHQNMFTPSCEGTQLFYSANHPCSKALALCIKDEIVAQVQPDNTRELKVGNNNIFLLHKTVKPTVLVECGFLSNAKELAKLKDPSYQNQLAFAIACGAARYAGEKGDIV